MLLWVSLKREVTVLAQNCALLSGLEIGRDVHFCLGCKLKTCICKLSFCIFFLGFDEASDFVVFLEGFFLIATKLLRNFYNLHKITYL